MRSSVDLPGAVAADQAQALAFGDAQRDVLEQQARSRRIW